MKYIFSILILSSCLSFGQLKPDRYDTSYSDGFIVTTHLTMKFAFIKPIVKMTVHVTKKLPCSTIYKWIGEDTVGDGYYWSGSVMDSTKDYGTCGFIGFSTMYNSKYKGDIVISYNCESSSYSTFKELYFIPDKRKKRKLGKEYTLKDNDYFGEMDKWEHPPFVIICG